MQDDTTHVHGPDINTSFTSARLRIEPLGGRHAALLFECLSDPAIYEWISLPRPQDVESLRARWERVARFPHTGVEVMDFAWAVQRIDDGAWLGRMDAEVTALGVATNVGYVFASSWWGQGYGTEAVAALSEHLRRRGVVRQHATVTLGNEASCRVLERVGFQRERVIPANDTLRGVLVDDVEYIRR
jgi:RimJ/RimL family protein N-acetyltransferase